MQILALNFRFLCLSLSECLQSLGSKKGAMRGVQVGGGRGAELGKS